MTTTIQKLEPKLHRAAGALGAYIHDFDIGKALDEEAIAFVRSAIIDHHVVCFRGQDITPAQHLAFTLRLGEIYVQTMASGMLDYPDVLEVFGAVKNVEAWHQDSTHSVRPPSLSILVARTVPSFGNDTHFVNQHLAFESLSPKLQDVLQSLRAVHQSIPPSAESQARYRELNLTPEVAVHPVVRTHPDTGRKGLYVNAIYTKHFEGMTEEESQPLLAYLYQQCGRSEFSFRHSWLPGDVLIWDNASVQHAVICDMPPGTERYMHRTTTIGPVPS